MNFALAQDFLSQLAELNDQTAAALASAAPTGSSSPPSINDPLGSTAGILQNGDISALLPTATVSALQLSQMAEDKGIQVKVGVAGIAFGMGITDREATKKIESAVYRDPNGRYWTWNDCLDAGSMR